MSYNEDIYNEDNLSSLYTYIYSEDKTESSLNILRAIFWHEDTYSEDNVLAIGFVRKFPALDIDTKMLKPNL